MQAKCRERLDLVSYSRARNLQQDPKTRSQYLGMAVFALLQVAHISKQVRQKDYVL